MKKLTLVVVFSLSCAAKTKCPEYVFWHYNVQGYEVIPDISIDSLKVDSTPNTNPELLQAIVDDTEQCLLDIGELTEQERIDGWCVSPIMEPVRRECLTVKVVDDYIMSCDGKEQLLKDNAPFEGCKQKGFEENPDCPCRWRAAIQDGYVLVTPPNMKLLSDVLIKVATNCAAPWATPRLAKCASISGGLSEEYYGIY